MVGTSYQMLEVSAFCNRERAQPPSIGTLSMDDEMGRRRRSEVNFSRANLVGMRTVVKSCSLRRRRNSGRFLRIKITLFTPCHSVQVEIHSLWISRIQTLST